MTDTHGCDNPPPNNPICLGSDWWHQHGGGGSPRAKAPGQRLGSACGMNVNKTKATVERMLSEKIQICCLKRMFESARLSPQWLNVPGLKLSSFFSIWALQSVFIFHFNSGQVRIKQILAEISRKTLLVEFFSCSLTSPQLPLG